MASALNYFAYASNLKESLVEERLGGHRPRSSTVARLFDYDFQINHRQSNGQPRANLVTKKGSHVLGVLYVVDKIHEEQLFATEPGYDIIDVQVQLQLSPTSTVQARTFLAQTTTTETLIPSKEYLQTILDGAREHHFPDEYIERIVSLGKSQKK